MKMISLTQQMFDSYLFYCLMKTFNDPVCVHFASVWTFTCRREYNTFKRCIIIGSKVKQHGGCECWKHFLIFSKEFRTSQMWFSVSHFQSESGTEFRNNSMYRCPKNQRTDQVWREILPANNEEQRWQNTFVLFHVIISQYHHHRGGFL